MKKKYSIVMVLIAFLAVQYFVVSKTETVFADVPAQDCPAGSMRLAYGDGSTTVINSVSSPADPWTPAPAPAPGPAPAPVVNWDAYLDDGIIDNYNRNGNWRNIKGNEQLLFEKLMSKAYAQEGGWDGGGQSFGTGPACADYSQYTNSNNVAHLACVVMQEQGGGPFCMNPSNNAIYNGLMDNTCRSHPGTQLAGFRIVATFPTFACGVASPVTDG